MILHPEFFVVGVGRNVEHVFNPVGAVGDLEFVPVRAVVFEPAVPVETKAKQINVEMILGSQVLDYESRMDQVATDLPGSRPISNFGDGPVNKGNRVSLRVANSEILRAVGICPNLTGREAMRLKVASHFRDVVGGERDFCDPVATILSLRLCWFEYYPLVRGRHEKTSLCTLVLRAAAAQSKNVGIEVAGLVDVADVDGYVVDAGNVRALERSGLQADAERKHHDCMLQAIRNSERRLHDCEILSHSQRRLRLWFSLAWALYSVELRRRTFPTLPTK